MNYKENDRVLLKHIETGQQKTITERWYDTRSGFLSLPDYEHYYTEEQGEFGWNVEWKVVKKLPKKKKKKSRS